MAGAGLLHFSLYNCIYWMTEVTQNANHIELIAICCDERLKLKLPDFQYLQTTVIILSLVLNMLQIKNIFWALLYTLKATTSTPWQYFTLSQWI